MKSHVATGASIGPLVLRVARETSESLQCLSAGQHQFSFENRSIVAQPIDTLRWLVEHVPSSKGVLHIRNILINAIETAELKQAGSGYIALTTALEISAHGDSFVAAQKADLISQAVKSALEKSYRVAQKDAFIVMSLYDYEPGTLGLVQEALEKCSSNASLSIETSGIETCIREINGNTFPCQVPEIFSAAVRFMEKRLLSGPRVIVIDGMVERMSEIENIIGGSHAAREPLVLFARGFAPDVQNTLGRNYSTGHLLAIPLVVPYDELGANLLGDISIVCGADSISSFKGDLISSRVWKDLRSVDSIAISPGCVSIVNEKTLTGVHRHRRQLGDKRKTCSSVEIDILDKRLQCLMGQGAVINVGRECGNLAGIYRDRIGSHIRIFRSIGRHGVVDVSGMKNFRHYHLHMSRFARVPAAALAVGTKAGISAANSLQRLGGIVCHVL